MVAINFDQYQFLLADLRELCDAPKANAVAHGILWPYRSQIVRKLQMTRTSTSETNLGLQLLLLGDFHAYLHGQPIAGVSYAKMRALLAYLAVERERDHRREVLANLLWGDRNATTARGNLRRTLSDLRRVLELPSGEVFFSVSKNSIRFVANADIDVHDFTAGAPSGSEDGGAALEHDERMLALYRGEFLADLSMSDCPEFENWLQAQREILHNRTLALLERLSNQYESTGNYNKALEFALRYCALEPWDEDACRRVMLLHAFNGQNKAALAQYEACSRLLKKELGVLPSEETLQLAERIRQGAVQRKVSDVAPNLRSQAIAQLPAQRRQVTVLYCELIPTESLDPEDAMALLHEPQARCVALIRQFGGHIVQTHGGGFLAYFGYPQAHEEAVRRAVQAALAVSREAVPSVDVRAGAHTGLIITGGDASQPDTSGRTTRITMQLRHHTQHHKVVISRDTHNIAAGYFDCLNLGAQALPGFEQTLELFAVRDESGARSRLDAAARLTPLIGRQTEVSKLMVWWEAATKGSRQVVLVRGEAGIGKSRLLHTLKERLASTQHAMRELRCFPEFSQSPFHPLITMIEMAVGIARGDLPQQKLACLEQYIECHFPVLAAEGVPRLAQLLSLPKSARYPEPEISPQKQKEQTIAVVLAMLQTIAAEQPVLLVMEDLHWVDPSTLELLTRFVEQAPNGRVLTVLTARPDFVPTWKDGVTAALELGPLGTNEVKDLVMSLRSDIAGSTLNRIVERADGVPLFAEEMAKMASADPRIPATLQDLLAARMDSLGEAKGTAQLAATLGREFDLEVLHKVLPDGWAVPTHIMDALQEAGLVWKISNSVFQFKHALIQEAAYESQTLSARKLAHLRIAHVLRSDFAALVANQPESLARHLAAGGETQLSIEYWIKAGQRAALGSAHAEALAHCNTGLQLLPTLPPSTARDHLEYSLRMSLGAARIATQGYGSIDAGTEYARAADLAGASGNSTELFTALWGMWLGSSSLTRFAHSLTLAQKLLQLAEQSQDKLLLQQAHYAMGNTLLWTGQLQQARIHQERGMAIYHPTHHGAMVRELGENICVSTGAQLAWVLWLQGLPDQALAMGERTLALAREVNHPYSLCYATSHLANLHRWLRHPEDAQHWAQETLAQALQNGFPLWVLSGGSFLGWAQATHGDRGGITLLQEGVEAVRAAMSSVQAFFLALLGDAHLRLGQHTQALAAVNQALEVMEAKGDRFLESEALRLKGECLLALPVPDAMAAEACFEKALTVSRHQGAKSLELRAATSLTRLLLQHDRLDPAEHVLNGVYVGFAQGLDTPDLVDARHLLARVASARDCTERLSQTGGEPSPGLVE